jgi:DNA-binding LacI/PurR family transcriptional regulator
MARGKPRSRSRTGKVGHPQRPLTLKALADYLELAPATVSLVMNRSPAAGSIPKVTQERIFQAAKQFDYRPNFIARSLRSQRSYTVGVMVPEISEGYAALVLSGIEDRLLQEGYIYFVASHRHKPDLIEEYPKVFLGRSVEGLILVDTPCGDNLPVPVIAVSGHHQVKGVTKIVLNHQRAAALALDHLLGLGHRRIAFIKGQSFSSDTEVRWNAICEAAQARALAVDPQLVVQLEGDSPSPELGYGVTRKLLGTLRPFTALFAFNDISAIGAIRALREAGLRVPEDVSVVGFDDIESAVFQNPALTTVRQPLRRMGELAAENVVRCINNPRNNSLPKLITVEPELIVRESTSQTSAQPRPFS